MRGCQLNAAAALTLLHFLIAPVSAVSSPSSTFPACRKLAEHDQTWVLSALTYQNKSSVGLSQEELGNMIHSIDIASSVRLDSWFISALKDVKSGSSSATMLPGLSLHVDTVAALRDMDDNIRCQVLLQTYQSGALTVHGIKNQLSEGKRLSSISRSSRLQAILSATDAIAEDADMLRLPVAQLVSLYSIYPELRPPLKPRSKDDGSGEEGDCDEEGESLQDKPDFSNSAAAPLDKEL